MILTTSQAYELENKTVHELPISSYGLMYNAGESVAQKAIEMIGDDKNVHIFIICGKGNNGGDGFATGASLANKKIKVIIHSIVNEKNILGDSLKYHNKCKKMNIPITYGKHFPKINNPEIIIDGLIGIGLKGNVRREILLWINWINDFNSKILSIDIPSGLNSSSGVAKPTSVKAHTTITFGAEKVGMLFRNGPKYCGNVHISDIGFLPIDESNIPGITWKKLSEKNVKSFFSKPRLDLNKYSAGKVLIIAGSRGMTGAAILSTIAALRSGAGLTITTSLKSLNNIYESAIIEGITLCLNDNGNGFLDESHYSSIMEKVECSDSILIGPGLGRNRSTLNLIKLLVQNINKPLVLDADGFYPYKNKLSVLNEKKSPLVITPHFGELSKLTGYDKELIISEFPNVLNKICQGFNHTILVKQIPNCIINKKRGIINTTGNQGLATAGTGDVLAGLISGLIAQGYDSFSAAYLGSFIHGKASDMVSDIKGFRGQVASDLLEMIPKVISAYEKS